MREQKLRILQVNKLYYPWVGGVERVVQNIAEGLNDSLDMTVLVCSENGAASTEIIHGVKVYKASSLGIYFSMPVSFDFISKFVALSKNSEIIHIHTPFPLADLALLVSGYKGKVVLWWHSDVVKQKKMMFIYRFLLDWLLKRADVIIVATEGHILYSSYLTKYSDKCVVIPFGVDFDFDAAEFNKLTTKPDDRDTCVILFVGRLVYYKGCDILLRAMEKVTGAELLIVGEGPLKDELQKNVSELAIENKVHFLGKLDEEKLEKIFLSCDLLVLPSVAKSEAFGLVQIEAMARGKPVINTNLPSGVPYVSLDGVTGITVPPSDPESLAKAIQKLVDDPQLRNKYGRAAFLRAKDFFSMRRMLSEVLILYKRIVGLE